MRAPESERELLGSARSLAGRSIGELAARASLSVPDTLTHAKGFIGLLVERALGADASTRPIPDFARLGLELKTLPIDRRGKPCASTYVTTVELKPSRDTRWETSRLRAKLTRVLWVPVELDPAVPIAARRFGTAVLWSPDADEERALRDDYEDLIGLIADGFIDSITAHRGTVLQIRPKAANARARTQGLDDEGGERPTLPRGFYLRAKFTAKILERHFGRTG